MLSFSPVISAPYEGRQPLVQSEVSSSGGPGAKPLRHQASLIRVSDYMGLCQCEEVEKSLDLWDIAFFSL